MTTGAPRLSPNGEMALALVRQGMRVFPLRPRAKRPLFSIEEGGKGFYDATGDADLVRAWWLRNPEANIGIATGDFIAVDIDPRNGGDRLWAELTRKHGEPPDTVTVFTGGEGGIHYYFAPPPGAVIPCGDLGPGIELKAHGGYVVGPGSTHPSGKRYELDSLRDFASPMAELPAWILAEAHPPEKDAEGDEIDAKHSYLGVALEAAGMLGKRLADGRRVLRCPWSHEHTTGKDYDSSTVLFAPKAGSSLGWFKCSHSHCHGRSWLHVLERLPHEAKQAADKAYPKPTSRAADRGDEGDEQPPSSGLRTNKKGRVLSTFGNVCIVLRTHEAFAGKFAFDTMAHAPVFETRVMTEGQIGHFREEVERAFSISPGRDAITQAIRTVAEEKSYHPVQDYLQQLSWDGRPRLASVGKEALGIDATPLEVTMLRKWFISAVARAMRPGCKADTCLILTGPIGLKKSTFFRVLGGDWFSDTAMNLSNKDSYQQLHVAWIYEWGELERVTSMKHAGEVKSFLSSQVDTYRPPYAMAPASHPRSGVIVGTTNEREFLADPTGSRRFWVVPVSRVANVSWLAEQRDQLWAEARVAFDTGEEWWLDVEQDKAREIDASQYERTDPWEGPIAVWLGGGRSIRPPTEERRFAAELLHEPGIITGGDILTHALDIPRAQQGHDAVTRVGKIMAKLGWPRSRPRDKEGTRLRGYVQAHPTGGPDP